MFKTIFSGHKTIWGGTINIWGALPPNARMATCRSQLTSLFCN